MAKGETSKDLLAGLFLLTGIGLFFLSIFVLGKERNLFGVFVPYNAFYSDVRGLNVGAPVRLGGIAVGRVAGIGLPEDINDARVMVALEVQEQFATRIRTDSTATIETQGLLGDKFINISGAGTGTQLPAAGTLASRESADLNNIIRKVEALADNATAGLQSVTDLTKALDPKRISEIVESVRKITHDLSSSPIGSDLAEVIREIRTGNGLLHTLIFEPSDGRKIQESIAAFTRVANNLDQITGALSKGSGTLGALLLDSKVYDNLVEVTDDAKRSVVLRSVVRSALNEKSE
jgi:phospholipid/cholesterol/gamma-HCH transport system substrate-binding protein